MAFAEFSIRRETRRPLAEPMRPLPEDSARRFRLSVRSERRGEGHWHHIIDHGAVTDGASHHAQAFFAEIDLPCRLEPLEILDPFVMMLAFHQMTLGGTLEVDGPISRRLLFHLAEIQAQSHNRWPETYRPFAVVATRVVDAPYATPRRDDGVIAVTGGLDSTLALYRQTDPELAAPRQRIGMAATVVGYNPHANRVAADYEQRHMDKMRRLCDRRGLKVGVIRTDLGHIPAYVTIPHGAVFGGLYALAAGSFPFALLASSASNAESWQGRGVAPEWQWTYGTGGFDVPSDLGFFTRAERVVLLAGYGAEACDGLIVCGTGENLPENCGHCAKCVRTILSFEAAGLPIPKCFPAKIDPSLVGLGASQQPETGYQTEILRLMAAFGTDSPSLRLLRRRYVRKALKRKALDFLAALRWS